MLRTCEKASVRACRRPPTPALIQPAPSPDAPIPSSMSLDKSRGDIGESQSQQPTNVKGDGHLIEAPCISTPLTAAGQWRARRLNRMKADGALSPGPITPAGSGGVGGMRLMGGDIAGWSSGWSEELLLSTEARPSADASPRPTLPPPAPWLDRLSRGVRRPVPAAAAR
jgi:hypothetical protein